MTKLETATPTMTALEAAQEIGIRLNYIYLLLREGKIRGKQIYGHWLVDRSSVEEFQKGRRRSA